MTDPQSFAVAIALLALLLVWDASTVISEDDHDF